MARIFVRFLYLGFVFLLSFMCNAEAQLVIASETNAQALAQKLVGDGVSISNITLKGSSLATGFFYNKGTNINLDSGIVLSNGRVKTVNNSFGFDGVQGNFASTELQTPGDADLSNLINGEITSDAVILEFDFIPLGDSIQFRYVFSSEEYPNYVCSGFNDAFAFFLEGPGITGRVNLALVPGTNIPVAINSINSGIPGNNLSIATCNAMGPGSPFTQYYISNAGNASFTHNGHTVTLIAASRVVPCQSYHLKIVIADAGSWGGQPDRTFDSGVFLEARSLSSTGIRIINLNPVLDDLPYLVEGCHNGSIEIARPKKLPFAQSVTLSFSGTAVNGIDINPISSTAIIPANDSIVIIPIIPIVDNLPEGMEKFKIYISNGCAGAGFYADSIEIQMKDYDTLSITPVDSAGICKATPFQLAASTSYANYQWTPAAGLNNPALHNPLATINADAVYSCLATIGNCHARDSVRLKIRDLELLSKKDIPCKNGTTGEIQVSGGWEWKQPVFYNINGGAFGTDSLFRNLPAGTYTIRIKDATGCMDSLVINLVQSYSDLTFTEAITSASCFGENGFVEFLPSGGRYPHLFSVDFNGFTVNTGYSITGGAHTLYVQDANGCIASHSIIVPNDPPITVNTVVTSAGCSGAADGSITATATGGSTTYEYSLSGVAFQSSNQFAVPVGPVNVIAKDSKGCTGSASAIIPFTNTVVVDAGIADTLCEGDIHQLSASTNAPVVTWSGPALSNASIINPQASPQTSSWYYIRATQGICTRLDSVYITVNPAPAAQAGDDSSICYGKTIRLYGSGGVEYKWQPASEVSDPGLPNPVIRPLQHTDYYLKVKDAKGCTSLFFDTVRISLVPAVQAYAGRDTVVAIDQPLQLTGKELGNSGVTEFEWLPVRGLNNHLIFNPITVLQKNITYRLTLKTPEGCEGFDSINIKVYKGPDIYVPSGFTPNNDGKNDVLRAIPVGIKSFGYFRVFSRWGDMIFSTSNPSIGWDGTMKGVKQTTGVFVWIAEATDYRGIKIQRKGTVTVIR